jgi:sugar transferase (PEP-CTERM/EpsH1 system associated)
MIAHLAQTHSVTVASLAHTKQELEEGKGLEKHCDEVIAEVVPDRVRWLNAVAAVPTATPSSVAYFRSQILHRKIADKVKQNPFDVVIVHCAFVAQYVESRYGVLRILDYGDMDSAKWREYAQTRRLPLSWGYALEAKKLRDYERRVAANFHHCTLTTQGERDEFETLATGIPSTVIPNGVDTSYFNQGNRRAAAEPVIAFLGRMDYFPNIDAVCYFAEEIFPWVRESIPAARFLVVGSDPSRRVRGLESISGVRVTGHVPDVRKYLKDSALSVAPLRIARGTQNKVLESMAMGVPVITSPQAAKGIQATPGVHMLVAADAQIFAQKVIQVLTNDALRRGLSTAARQHLDRTHSWPISMKLLDDLIEREMPQNRRDSALRPLVHKIAVPTA